MVVDATHGHDWLSAVYSDVHLVTRDDGRSSSTAPSLMATMLQALELTGAERVLEIGAGTGYNAALLSERLGDDRVVSVDIAPDLADQARRQLALAGYRPLVKVADGIDGFPGAGVSRPYSFDATIYRDNEARFWLDLTNPDVRTATVDGVSAAYRPDGSWTRLVDGLVVQGGPAAVWDDVETAYEEWIAAGRPARERYRLLITDRHQRVLLDDRPEPVPLLRPPPG